MRTYGLTTKILIPSTYNDNPVSASNTYPYKCPIHTSGDYNTPVNIDWGDGTIETYSSGANHQHNYETAGYYYVRYSSVTGQLPEMKYSSDSVSNLNTSNNDLIEVSYSNAKYKAIPTNSFIGNYDGDAARCNNVTFFDLCYFRYYTTPQSLSYPFCGLSKLNITLKDETFTHCNFTDLRYLFAYCTLVHGSIPSGFFCRCTSSTLQSLFAESGISGAIPAGLFDNFTSCTGMGDMFNSTGITSIPEGLFDNNTAVTAFHSVFYGCTGITSIPEGLFDNNTAATNFSGTFSGCSGLTSIPSGLFDNNTKVTNLTYCFQNCSGLTGSIPADLFKYNTEVTRFYGIFSGCSGLTGSIPTDLFKYNINVTDLGCCFQSCSGLTGSIPTGLFDNNTKVTSLTYCFQNCSGLTGSIPADLFKYNTEVTSFYSIFSGCSGLTGTIPTNLFDNHPKSLDFSSCFAGCSNLIPQANIFSTTFISDLADRTSAMKWNYLFHNTASNITTSYTLPALWQWTYGSGVSVWAILARTTYCTNAAEYRAANNGILADDNGTRGTSLAYGGLMVHGGQLYKCINPNGLTKTHYGPPDDWSDVSYSDWASGVWYTNGFGIYYNGQNYKCTTTHLSTSTFDDTKWEVTTITGT